MNVLIIDEKTLEMIRRELSDCEVFTGYNSLCYEKIKSSIEKLLLVSLDREPRIKMIKAIESFDHIKIMYIQISEKPLTYRFALIAVFKDTTGALLAKLSI